MTEKILDDLEAKIEAVVIRIQKNHEASEEVEEGLIDIMNRIDDMKTALQENRIDQIFDQAD